MDLRSTFFSKNPNGLHEWLCSQLRRASLLRLYLQHMAVFRLLHCLNASAQGTAKNFPVFEERHSLCSKNDMPCVRRQTHDETLIFGRTDLRKGVSEAKFDAEADFDVKKCLAPPKSAENCKKPKKNSRKKFWKNFFGVEKSKVANRPKRVFPKFRGDRSEVRGANGKFWCGARRCRIKSRKQMSRRHLLIKDIASPKTRVKANIYFEF